MTLLDVDMLGHWQHHEDIAANTIGCLDEV